LLEQVFRVKELFLVEVVKASRGYRRYEPVVKVAVEKQQIVA
jgi:hypothetical protein